MWDWFQRHQQRHRDLERGVDADLVQANQRRWKLFVCLFGLAFFSLAISAWAHLSGLPLEIGAGITALLFIGAAIVGRWASLNQSFLNKPDPKEPPRLWKWRR
ncbi:MAG: hypothetical protein LAO19_20940 [Acidobacteriia bacterium]|nr:hypothetical protein [Terriglobia bacterium]